MSHYPDPARTPIRPVLDAAGRRPWRCARPAPTLVGLASATVMVDVMELAVALRVGHTTGLAGWALALTLATVAVAVSAPSGGEQE